MAVLSSGACFHTLVYRCNNNFNEVLFSFFLQFCKSSKKRQVDVFSNAITYDDSETSINNNRKSRQMINNDKILCSECCEGDLCNSQGCSEPGITIRRLPQGQNRTNICFTT